MNDAITIKDIRRQLKPYERALRRNARMIMFRKLRAAASRIGKVIFWIYFVAAIAYFAFQILRANAETIIINVGEDPVEVQQPRVVLATVTAYTSSVDETDNTPFITASGAHTRPGIVACPPEYAFGTRIEFEGEKYECQDRMAPRYQAEGRFDVWVGSKGEAWNWGKKQGEVLVLTD